MQCLKGSNSRICVKKQPKVIEFSFFKEYDDFIFSSFFSSSFSFASRRLSWGTVFFIKHTLGHWKKVFIHDTLMNILYVYHLGNKFVSELYGTFGNSAFSKNSQGLKDADLCHGSWLEETLTVFATVLCFFNALKIVITGRQAYFQIVIDWSGWIPNSHNNVSPKNSHSHSKLVSSRHVFYLFFFITNSGNRPTFQSMSPITRNLSSPNSHMT